MANITVKRSGTITIDADAVAKTASDAIMKQIRARLSRGVDANGARFAPYSALYAAQLAAIGEPVTPDLSRSGGLIKSLGLKRARARNDKVTLTFGAGRGSSSSPARPPPWLFSPKKSAAERAAAIDAWKRARKKRPKRVSYARLLVWQSLAIGGRRARPLLGLLAGDRAPVLLAVRSAHVFRSR